MDAMKSKKPLHGTFILGGKRMTNRLRDTRVLKRVTQYRLSLQTDINATKISFIENGLVEPRDDEKKRLAQALGANPEELFPVEAR
jgi:transcriptional regulator with XRE-family HTH domain